LRVTPLRAAGRSRSSALSPLRWVAEEDLVYDPRANTPHRPGCPSIAGIEVPTSVPMRSALELVWAPRLCGCRPDVTLALGR